MDTPHVENAQKKTHDAQPHTPAAPAVENAQERILDAQPPAAPETPEAQPQTEAERKEMSASEMLRSLKPTDAEGHYNLAGMLNSAGDYAGARFLYHRTLVINPNHVSAAYNLGNLLYTVFGEFSEAEIYYRRAIDVDSKHLPSLCNYGTLLKNELNDLEGAVLLYSLAQVLDPSDTTVMGNQCAVRAAEAERRGELLEAAHLYREACAAWERGWLADDDPDVKESMDAAQRLTEKAERIAKTNADNGSANEMKKAGVGETVGGGESNEKDQLDSEEGSGTTLAAVQSKEADEDVAVAAVLEKRSFMSKFSKSFSLSRSFRKVTSRARPARAGKREQSGGVGEATCAADLAGATEDDDNELVEDHRLSPPSSATSLKASPKSPLFGRRSTSFTEKEADALLAKAMAAAAAEPEEEEGENQEEQENGDESDDTGVYDDEEGEIDFAGAALLEEGRTTAERLREPRTIVSRANKLVAEKKFSAALSHYYDALDILDTLTAQAEAESTQYEEVRQQQRRQQEEEARQDSRGRTSPTLQLLHHQPLSQRDVLRDTAKTLNNLAAVLHQLRKFDEAMAVYERALDIKKRSDGEEHFSVGHTLYNMACLHMDHGKRRKAAHYMRESVFIYESCFGKDHQLTIDVEQQLLGLLTNDFSDEDEDQDDSDDSSGTEDRIDTQNENDDEEDFDEAGVTAAMLLSGNAPGRQAADEQVVGSDAFFNMQMMGESMARKAYGGGDRESAVQDDSEGSALPRLVQTVSRSRPSAARSRRVDSASSSGGLTAADFVGKQRQESMSLSRLGKPSGRPRNRPRPVGGGQSMLASHRRVDRNDVPEGIDILGSRI